MAKLHLQILKINLTPRAMLLTTIKLSVLVYLVFKSQLSIKSVCKDIFRNLNFKFQVIFIHVL